MRYYGGKSKLVPFIMDAVRQSMPSENMRVSDAFAGTGVVALEFQNLGHQVSANDNMYLSYCLNFESLKFSSKEALGLSETRQTGVELCDHLNHLPDKWGVVTEEFSPQGNPGRRYFSSVNAMRIDAIRTEIEDLFVRGEISIEWKIYLIAKLLRAINKVSNTSGTYSAFMKTWDSRALKDLKLENQNEMLRADESTFEVECSDVYQYFKNKSFDLVYLDPPYNSRDYSTNYGILEFISAGFPNEHSASGFSGAVKFPEKKSPFASKRLAHAALEGLISDIDASTILLSYSNEGIVSPSQLIEICSKWGDVSILQREHKRFRSINQDGSVPNTTEFIYQIRKY